jgi:hypothetical protein
MILRAIAEENTRRGLEKNFDMVARTAGYHLFLLNSGVIITLKGMGPHLEVLIFP